MGIVAWYVNYSKKEVFNASKYRLAGPHPLYTCIVSMLLGAEWKGDRIALVHDHAGDEDDDIISLINGICIKGTNEYNRECDCCEFFTEIDTSFYEKQCEGMIELDCIDRSKKEK